MSNNSHKSSPKNGRVVKPPQRSNGKLRVAAILEAAAAVVDEKGYEGATMAEIATRSGTKIGSLYRFFPNKESLADTILAGARENLTIEFDRLDADVRALSIRELADGLMNLIIRVFTWPAFRKILDGDQQWSVKREEFRQALLEHIAKTLKLRAPKLAKKSAEEIALVVLLNGKTVATHQAFFQSAPNTPNEIRDMTRLYLKARLG